ncbi:MAG: hypothetical protein JSS07_11430 [Proteobacteria bacterium]|nr:hypothetical protein [Pseudomonadota bacterium]
MNHKILTVLSGIGFLCYFSNVSAIIVMHRGNVNPTYFSTTTGRYTEYRISGYDIQPNRPGVWYKGCRTDNYYCMAQLEHCRVFEGGMYKPAPNRIVPRPEGLEFKEPAVLKDHR